jgi:hypothetical protein
MTHVVSRNRKSQQSGSVRRDKMASSVLLAAVLILGSSLGVTAAQVNQPKETVKTNPPVSQKPVSKGIHIEKGPDPRVLLNPQPLPPSPSEKPR